MSCCLPDWEKAVSDGAKQLWLNQKSMKLSCPQKRRNPKYNRGTLKGGERLEEKGEREGERGGSKRETLNSIFRFHKGKSSSPLMLITRGSKAGESRANKNS